MSLAEVRREPPPALSGLDPQIVDLSPLLEQLAGDEGQLRELLRLFLADVPSRRQSLGRAVRERDPDGVHQAAHPMKGACAQLGAGRAQQAFALLETAGKTSTLNNLTELHEQAENEMNRLLVELAPLLGDGTDR